MGENIELAAVFFFKFDRRFIAVKNANSVEFFMQLLGRLLWIFKDELQ